jgi:hypothetical protein
VGKGALGAVPTRTLRQIEMLRVGTADPPQCVNQSVVAAFAHPTESRRFHRSTLQLTPISAALTKTKRFCRAGKHYSALLLAFTASAST